MNSADDLLKELESPFPELDMGEHIEAAGIVRQILAENTVMREYIHSQGLSDKDIQLWIESAQDRQEPEGTK